MLAAIWDNQLPETIKDYQLYMHPWKPASTKDNLSFTYNPRGQLKSGTTSSICSPRGLVPLGTPRPANTMENQMAKGLHRNTIIKSQCNMSPAEPSYLTTEQPLHFYELESTHTHSQLLKEEKVYFNSQFEGTVIIVGKSRQRDREASGDTLSTGRKRDECWSILPFYSD